MKTKLFSIAGALLALGLVLAGCENEADVVVSDVGPYTVTYDVNGGSGAPYSSQSVEKRGATITLPGQGDMVAPEDRYFSGWSNISNYNSYLSGSGYVLYKEGSSYTVNYSVTLYAVWSDYYTVTYDVHGGSGTPPPSENIKESGKTITLPGQGDMVAPEGGYFSGWSDSSYSYGTLYEEGSSYTVNYSVTLYAIWGSYYTVTYDVNGGSGTPPPPSETVKGETTITLPGQSDMVAPEGKYFSGWATYASSSYSSEEGSSYTVNSSVTLYAIWASYYAVITFSAGEGTGTPPPTQNTKQSGQTITLPGQGGMTAPEGRFFSGWKSSDYSSSTYRPGSEYAVTWSITLTAQWDYDGVYIGLISFAGEANNLITSTTIPSLAYLDSSGKSSVQSSLNYSYNKSSQSGTALYYAVHKALANLTAAESSLPQDIHSVNLITFTDGLDNGSFLASTNNPIEGKSGLDDYAAYVKEQIGGRKIGGKTINAYSIGVKGSDVTDDTLFNKTLSSIASGETNVESLDDFSKLEDTLNGIAENIDVNIQTTPNFRMVTTGNVPGTIIRMTFDVSGDTPTEAEAAAATRYIDGTLAYDSGKYSLTNIRYSAGITSESGTNIVGTVDVSEVSFMFYNISGYDSTTDTPKQWLKTPGSNSWQINSEYSADGSKDTTVNVDTTLIYLVLDASTSLSDTQITQIRTAVNKFITTLYNRTHPTN